MFDYRDEHGTLLFQVVRFPGKKFRQRRPIGLGRWEWSLEGVRRVLYRLPELLAADPKARVYIVEGEKDVDTLRTRGLVATCNPFGALKWSTIATHASQVLRERDVTIVADADPPEKDVGRPHARQVAKSLKGVAASVTVLEPPPPHKDVSELLGASGTLDQLVPLVGEADGGAVDDDSPANDDGGEGARTRYRILGPEEIYAPLPEPVYAIGGLVRVANLALIVAFGSSLKTWAMVDLLVAHATGGRFLDRFDCPTPSDALVIDWESGEEELRRRTQLVSRARGLSFPVPGVHMITMPDLFFTSSDFEGELEKLASTYKLITFDSLAAGSLDIDENDARFAKGLQICRRVAERQKTTIVVLHHSRKDGGEDSDERQSVRGTGAIFAAADVVLSLRRPEKAEEAEDAFVVRQTKARGGRRVDPFNLRVEDTANGDVRVYATDLNGDDVGGQVMGASARLAEAKRSILLLLGKHRDLRSKSDIARRVRGRKQTVLDGLEELIEHGLVVHSDGFFRLASEVSR